MKNKSTSAFCTLILICCFLLSSVNKVVAQENGIYELTEDNQLSKQIANKKGNSNDRAEFYNLSQKLHSTFYYENNKLKNKYGDGSPLRLNLEDINSFSAINKNDTQFNDIQIITVSLKNENDLNKILDVSNMPGFSSLKYIFIRCHFNCDALKIRKFIKKSDRNIRVFYTTDRPS
tara:strand:- start:1357 stop:1884 length:528 start_codon:yes stop_codon:yes gene_type:complete